MATCRAHAARTVCIAMSTTEAELVALAQCAIEMIYIISLLKFIGYVCKGDVMVETDNKVLIRCTYQP